jgi:fatty acid desaturase
LDLFWEIWGWSLSGGGGKSESKDCLQQSKNAVGLALVFIQLTIINKWTEKTYRAPANAAALFFVIVGSGGLHMMITSWSDIITTPGIWGNQTRTLIKP